MLFWKKLISVENSIRHPLLLLLRLYWGGLLFIVGLGKWLNIHEVADHFSFYGLPFPLITAYVVGSLEMLGGVSLFLGFLSRLFAPILVILFVVAYLVAHLESVKLLFTSPSVFIDQDPFLFLLTALIITVFGPGLFSLDYFLKLERL